MIDVKDLLKTYRNTVMANDGIRRLKAAVKFSDSSGCSIIMALQNLRRELGAMSPDAQRYTDFTLAKVFFSNERNLQIKLYAVNKFLIRACNRAKENPQAERTFQLWLRAWKNKIQKELRHEK